MALKPELEKQGAVYKEAAKISLELLKVAEQKLKSINIALEAFKKKYGKSFPVSEFEEHEESWRGGRHTESSLDKLSFFTRLQRGTDRFSSGEPVTDTFSVPIIENRFVQCDSIWQKEKNLITKANISFTKTENIHDKNYNTIGKKQVQAPPETICVTIGKPNKVFLFPTYCSDTFSKCREDLDTSNYVSLSSTEDLGKALLDVNKASYHSASSLLQRPDLWQKANTVIDAYQDKIIQTSQHNQAQMEQQKAYIIQQKAKAPIKINLN